MNVRNPTFDDELTMLYGARFAVSRIMQSGSAKYIKRYDKWRAVKWEDIFNYLTNKINELENERR